MYCEDDFNDLNYVAVCPPTCLHGERNSRRTVSSGMTMKDVVGKKGEWFCARECHTSGANLERLRTRVPAESPSSSPLRRLNDVTYASAVLSVVEAIICRLAGRYMAIFFRYRSAPTSDVDERNEKSRG